MISSGELSRIRRRPHRAERLENFEDVRFISERGPWDADEVDAVWASLGLYDLVGATTGEPSEVAWLQRRALEFCRTGQITLTADPERPKGRRRDRLDDLQAALLNFRDEREWAQFHTLRHLIAALSVEAGELLELTLWKTDEEVAALAAGERADELQNECADILAYLLLIADRAGFDIVGATRRKIEINGLKYPVHKAKGSAKKYTEL